MKLGFAMTGSFCTHAQALSVLDRLLSAGHGIVPIVSFSCASGETRFGTAAALIGELEKRTGKKPIASIAGAEPLGPKEPLDLLLICPCTGNTLAKLAAGITDTPVTMAAKAHLRQGRPLVIALASNDAMSANLKNLGTLSEKKSVYFVPLRQDDPEKKPYSLVCDFSLCESAVNAAAEGKQLRPLFL